MRVLIVEDETVLAQSIARGLRREGMAVDIAYDGEEALAKAAFNNYDIIVLDRDLPVIHGDDVCRQLVADGTAACILMLTASGTIDDKVHGLTMGADDYLSKPFAFAELVVRIQALGRRAQARIPVIIERHNLKVDITRRTVSYAGTPITLTAKEFAVLEILLKAEGRVVSTEELLEKVWDEHTDPFTNTVRTTIRNIRRKLGDQPIIETVIGVGYRIE